MTSQATCPRCSASIVLHEDGQGGWAGQCVECGQCYVIDAPEAVAAREAADRAREEVLHEASAEAFRAGTRYGWVAYPGGIVRWCSSRDHALACARERMSQGARSAYVIEESPTGWREEVVE